LNTSKKFEFVIQNNFSDNSITVVARNSNNKAIILLQKHLLQELNKILLISGLDKAL